MKLFLNKIIIFFSVFGPATITAISDNDAAGVATYSLAGANFGYTILFILTFVTVLLAITQEMGVRIALVTGKGLGDLIRERYGVRMSVFIFSFLFIANLGTVIANFSALKTTSIMFNFPVIPFIIFIVFFAFFFVTHGSYKLNQRIFLIGMILYFSYVISAIKAQPDWVKAFTNLVIPTQLQLSKEYIVTAIAVIGTTITPWGQFFVQSFVNDKKLSIDRLKYAQIETYFGAFLTNVFSFFMIVATAATLYIHNIPLISGEQASLAIKPFAGELASILFGVGLINAAIMGIVIISLSTAYAFSEFFGYEGSLDASYQRGKLFYGIFLFQLVLAGIIVMIPSLSLFSVVLYTQSINALLLPVIFYFLLKLSNDPELMKGHKNSKWYNYFAGASTILILIAALSVVVLSIVHF